MQKEFVSQIDMLQSNVSTEKDISETLKRQLSETKTTLDKEIENKTAKSSELLQLTESLKTLEVCYLLIV